ncbi:MAG TPA: CdaR family protein [Verrucomicrobiae bacterium]|jgi:YbbR domain-containing protein|nr:CdaR family protein [Verrucomicrobiae bacterium]
MALRDIVLHNFWWKLLSLLLAALTWLTIETALRREEMLRQTPVVGSYSRDFPAVPITLLTASTNANHFRIDPDVASVRISGPADQLQKLQERDIHVYIDLSDVGDEKQLRRNIQAQVPKDLKVEDLKPTYTSVERISNAK